MKEQYTPPEKITSSEIGEYNTVNQVVTDLKNTISILGSSGFEAFKLIIKG